VKEESIRIQQLCKQYDALFFIDDYVELAMELKADGVHLGQNDMPVKEARMLSNNQLLIGGTANTFEQIESLYQQKADYIGLGPYRFTKTKENLSAVLGSKGVEEIIAKCRRKGIDIPIHIIGGIRKADVLPILKAGAHGVAVSSAILQANLPIEEAAAFVSAVKKEG
jgi:thiamine-phosphate pyrophosphorylase